MSETIQSIYTELGIDITYDNIGLQRLSAVDSKFLRDLKLNVNTVLGSNNYNKKETALLALAVAVNEKNEALIKAFGDRALKEGATDAELAETHACTALMNTNNIFYRFRHYMDGVEYYNNQPAGLRMSSLMNPVMGKEFFEMMSLVISAINNCERCITSHEHSVKEHGATKARIYDGIRLGAVIKSLCVVI